MDLIDPTTLALANRALDATSLRHAAHAQNIANAHAEGAAAVRVRFEEHLGAVRAAIQAGRAVQARDIPQPEVVRSETGGGRIQLDEELAALARNALHHQALTRALGRHFALLSLAVAEGRR